MINYLKLYRLILVTFVLCFINLTTSVLAQGLTITNFSVSGDSVILCWNTKTNRFIIEGWSVLGSQSFAIGSSSNIATDNITVPLLNPNTSFYRVQSGLQIIEFPDESFREIIYGLMSPKLAPTNEIYDIELLELKYIPFNILPSSKITNLSGIEYARNLTSISLSHNQISNITPLSQLHKVTGLNLSANQINNCEPLSCMTNMGVLTLWGNNIQDITPLGNLTEVTSLALNRNQIVNIGPLTNMTHLSQLHLQDNLIYDITSLANMLSLNRILLSDNDIVDISALVTNAQNGGLGIGEEVYLSGNPLSMFAQTNQIPLLTNEYGVVVVWP